jgi:hypothetical protein
MYRSQGSLATLVTTADWPVDFFEPDDLPAFLDRIYVLDYQTDDLAGNFFVRIWLAFEGEIAIGIPGLEGVKLVFGGSDVEGYTFITAALIVGEESSLTLENVSVAFRFDKTILTPVALAADAPAREFAEISMTGSITITKDFDVDFQGFDTLKLTPAMIGDSGVIISADDIKLALSRTNTPPEILAAGFEEGFLGLFIGQARVRLPAGLDSLIPQDICLSNAAIGSGGFSGSLGAQYTPVYDPATKTFTGPGAGQLFGTPFGLKDLALSFRQNAMIESQVTGQILLPFFDQPVDVSIGLNLDGGFSCQLLSESGLYTLTKPGAVEIELDSLGFEVSGDTFKAMLSGKLTPLFGGLDWPSFQVKELSIDSEGNIVFAGGWLDLRDQYALDFHGFKMELTKLGLGKTEDGGKWIGLSGAIHLVDGLPAGASVEGLRLIWYEDGRDPRVTLNGVGVEFEIPDVLRFKGAISYDGECFRGAIKVALSALSMEIDGQLVVGTDPISGAKYFAIYLAAELPAGIPLASTGLALYGMAGLFAYQMEPDKRADEEWYGMGDGDGWYKRSPVGVAELAKWRRQPGSLALGAGVTIGTLSDNGFIFSGRMLLAIVFPGPILLIEGKANLLRPRAQLSGDDPMFRALAVLDARAGTFLVGIDAHYKYDDEGQLIDIHGSSEAYFSFSDASAWHLYLGQDEPREKRIRAQVLSLFEANSYFMLDATRLAMGAYIGWDKRWKFGPLRVTVEAWIEGGAAINFQPLQFMGELLVHGKAELSVFGFGLGLSVDARLAAEVFDPFHLVGEFSVGINLPWPLPDFDVDVKVEWGPRLVPPPLPLPLKEVAIEHLKVTTSWPLPRKLPNPSPPPDWLASPRLLLPDYNSNNDGYLQEPDIAPTTIESSPPPQEVPVVPMDCRPHITFARPVNDDALVGVNVHPGNGIWEVVGDPEKNQAALSVRYGLKGIALHKWLDVQRTWGQVARKGSTGQPDDASTVPELYGSWAPVPGIPDNGGTAVAQTKLWIWSKTPFDYTRHTGRTWDEWFSERFSDYPCIPDAPQREASYDFERITPYEILTTPWAHPHNPALIFEWAEGIVKSIQVLDQPVCGLTHALCFPPPAQPGTAPNKIPNILKGIWPAGWNQLTWDCIISLPRPNQGVRLTYTGTESLIAAVDEKGQSYGPFQCNSPQNPQLEIPGENLAALALKCANETCILGVCMLLGPDPEEQHQREEMLRHLREEMARWTQIDDVLEPDTIYRLKLVTTLEAKDYPYDASVNTTHEQTEYVYFRTGGPPGIAQLSIPANCPAPDQFSSGLDDLAPYVRQTVPPTVPTTGQQPRLPRLVYRAYDIGVEFNESYVDLMYRLGRRDLGLYLYDNNNRPMRDSRGRLMVLPNRWGETEDLTLTESEETWIKIINSSDCVALDEGFIPKDKTLTAEREGQVLDPDTAYEARLVPLLIHEDFRDFDAGTVIHGPDGVLDGWYVRDTGTHDGPSSWKIEEEGSPPSKYVIQTSHIWDSPYDGSTLLRADSPGLSPGDPGQPGNWTDYRATACLRSGDPGGAIGMVFRHIDADNTYMFLMDGLQPKRELVRIQSGHHTVLAGEQFLLRANRDYEITVEAIGSSLRVYQDGDLIISVEDGALRSGTTGLFCGHNRSARFSDVRIDDLRPDAPVAYRFRFASSRYADFYHQLHSFQDETWPLEADLVPASVDDALVRAVSPETVPSEDEYRAYETVASQILGASVRQASTELQITRGLSAGPNGLHTGLLLMQSPEPFDWSRTDLKVFYRDERAAPSTVPGPIKLAAATLGGAAPNDESVTLLLRKPVDLSGSRVEYYGLPGPLNERRDAGQQLPLGEWQFMDDTATGAPSSWRVTGDSLVQMSLIGENQPPAFPGTRAIAGDPAWTDYRFSVSLCSNYALAIGVIFRYADAQNYYRLWLDKATNRIRLASLQDGAMTMLWEASGSLGAGQPSTLTVEVVGSRLAAYRDGTRLFDLSDEAHAAGQVGLYCCRTSGAYFDEVTVCRPLLDAYALFRDRYRQGSLSEWTVIDEGTVDAPSHWWTNAGMLQQTSRIRSAAVSLAQPGTLAVAGDTNWEDFLLTARLTTPPDDGSIGLLFRYLDQNHYYRFSMDRRKLGGCRLVKNVGGHFAELWASSAMPAVGRECQVTIVTIGSSIRGYLDDIPIFVVEDHDLSIGQMGLYCYANNKAGFSEVRVYPSGIVPANWLLDEPFDVLLSSRWAFVDDGDQDGPSQWAVTDGVLHQSSGIFGGSTDSNAPEKPGTYAVAGEAGWRDYRLSVQLGPGGGMFATGTIGVMFRYLDRNNYYRFSMARQDGNIGYRRLIKKVAGQVTVLWEDPALYTPWQHYLINVDCMGDTLNVCLNGESVCSVRDNDIGSGGIGLYCWRDHQACFSDVRVAEPTWAPYYSFGREAPLSDGRRIQVLSGNEREAPPGEAGVKRRFVATLEDYGRIHLPADHVRLRLRTPDGRISHERTFLAASSYTPLAARILRRSDGTEFCIVLPAGSLTSSSPQPGQYRLEFSFRREKEKSGKYPDEMPLSEAGNSTPEQVRIDFGIPPPAQ